MFKGTLARLVARFLMSQGSTLLTAQFLAAGCFSSLRAVAAMGARGRKRKPWEDCEEVQLPADSSLRECAKRWLQQKTLLHKALTPSTVQNRFALIAKCAECSNCTKEWLFTQLPDSQKMLVQAVGQHADSKNLQAMRKKHAQEYAKKCTAAEALHKMELAEVPIEHRPQPWQIKNFRPSKGESRARLAADCMMSLAGLVQRPPESFLVDPSSVCSESEVKILFGFNLALDWLRQQSLSNCLMDFTHRTNAPNLLLGAIGPVGLFTSDSGKPAMRFFPVFFLLARTEDHATRLESGIVFAFACSAGLFRSHA